MPTTKVEQETAMTNEIEIRVVGLMRSGNHAIISWIQEQHAGHPTCFLNNLRHGDVDPYNGHRKRIVTGIDENLDTEQLRSLKKRLLIYSYEDFRLPTNSTDYLASALNPEFEANRERYVGRSRHWFDILIVRDAFNLLASRLAVRRKRASYDNGNLQHVACRWKQLAREALRREADRQPGQLTVRYNQWVADEAYRRRLSSELLGEFNDSSLDDVPGFGGGSSFDKTHTRLTTRSLVRNWNKCFSIRRFARLPFYWQRLTAPQARKMNVAERWKVFADDPEYLRTVADPELLELSEALFGEIPGTRRFINGLRPQQQCA